MSLVGSLEDLGLGDILQIVSLSRKSGLLMIHSEEGEGRIVFCDGLVRAAYVKGEASDLRDLLVATGFVADEEFGRAADLASARDEPLDGILPDCTELTRERLDSLRREHIERSVFRIFSWKGGEFSFEVRDEVEPRDAEILLPTGINAQYLTMEATRIDDEGDRSEIDEIDEFTAESGEIIESDVVGGTSDEEAFSFSGEVEPEPTTDGAAIDEAMPDEGIHADVLEVVALAAARDDEVEEAPASSGAASSDSAALESEEPGSPGANLSRPVCLIVIDPELAGAEWQKANLSNLFQRVHIFQSCEAGIARIRQYLARGDLPVTLVSNDLSLDSANGSNDVGEFVRRLKQQTPQMPVLVSWVEGDESDLVPLADAMIRRPNIAFVSGRRSPKILDAAVSNLRSDVVAYLDRASTSPGPKKRVAAEEPASQSRIEEPASGLNRLRETSQRMRDPNTRGEVLSLVLEFASESFSRVAIFMVRDETAVGMAQSGLSLAGGPGDDEFSGIEIPAGEIEWFARVIEQRTAISEAPNGDGDRALSLRLGDRTPSAAYIAPIESGGRVVALLYADNLPDGKSVPDTTILEIVLHEAGLALERALLERALARTDDDTSD